jgi:23S rRNA (guanosine2251-2'-O)-methyltransferase
LVLNKSEIIYGYNPIVEAIRSGKEIEKIFVLKSMLAGRANPLISMANRNKIPFQFVPKEKLNKLTRQNHQGVVAIISQVSYVNIETLLPGLFESGNAPLLLVLDKITDVRNLGSIARSAECAGADAIVIPARGSAMVNSDAVKTSSGALTKIPLCRQDNLLETIIYLKNSGITLIGASEKAEQLFYHADFNQPVAVILGSEDTGISNEYLKMCDVTVKIPLKGDIGSLNVAVAAGIILFEAVRQRNQSC